jgi:quinol monooxygenase YgiN
MSAKHWSLPALAFATLALMPPALMAPASAQDNRQFVVTYVEFLPAVQDHGAQLLQRLAAVGRASQGAISFTADREIGRSNFYVLIEVWRSSADYQDFKNSATTKALLNQIQPFLEAPFDERDGTLIE